MKVTVLTPQDILLFIYREMPSQKSSEPPVIISMSRSLDTQALPEGPAGVDTYLFAPIDPGTYNGRKEEKNIIL